MELTLRRDPSFAGATLGTLYADGAKVCHTLEDQVRERQGQPVALWKVHGRTAIPEGRYQITLENSPRFGPDTLTINDVPGFTWVRMHAGNEAQDTEGCVLLGLQVTPMSIVGGTSRPAVQIVGAMVREALETGDEVWLTITNPQGYYA